MKLEDILKIIKSEPIEELNLGKFYGISAEEFKENVLRKIKKVEHGKDK